MDRKQAPVPQAVRPAPGVTCIEASNGISNGDTNPYYPHQEPAVSPIRTGMLPPRARMDSVGSYTLHGSGMDEFFSGEDDCGEFFVGNATSNQNDNTTTNSSVLYKNGAKTKYSHPGERTSEILPAIGYPNFSTDVATPRRHPGRSKSPLEPDYVSPMTFAHDSSIYHFQALPPPAAPSQAEQQRKNATMVGAAAGGTSEHVLIPRVGNNVAGPMWTAIDLAHRPPLQEGATPLVRRFLEVTQDPSDEHQARRVLIAYRQFLTLVTKHKDWMYTQFLVPKVVQEMWYTHAMNVPMYCHDCMLLCGHVVGGSHMDPTRDFTKEECKRRRDFTLEQLQLLNKKDGDDVDEGIWSFDDILGTFEDDDDDDDDDDEKAKKGQEKDASPTDATTITTATLEQEPTNESVKAGQSEEQKEMDLSQESDSNKNNEKNDDDDADSEHSSCDTLSDPINVSVCLNGNESPKAWFKIRPKTVMWKLFENIPYNKFGVRDPENVQYLLAPRRQDGASSDDFILIDPNQEAMTLGLQNNDQINLVLKSDSDNQNHNINDNQSDEDEIYKPVASIAETEAEEPTASSLYIHDDGNNISINDNDNMAEESSDDEVDDESPPAVAEQNKEPMDNEDEKSLPDASEEKDAPMDEDETSLPDAPRENAVPMRRGGKALHVRSGSGIGERSRSAVKKYGLRNARRLPVRRPIALKPVLNDDAAADDDDSPSPTPNPAGEAGLGAVVSPDAVDRPDAQAVADAGAGAEEEVGADAGVGAEEEVGTDMDEKNMDEKEEEEAVVVTGSDDGNHDTDQNDHEVADVGLKEEVNEIIVLDGADDGEEDNKSEPPPTCAPAANRRRTRAEGDFEEIELAFPSRVAKKQKKGTTNAKAATTTTKKKESNIKSVESKSNEKISKDNSKGSSKGNTSESNSKDDKNSGSNSKDNSKGGSKGSARKSNSKAAALGTFLVLPDEAGEKSNSKADSKGNSKGDHSTDDNNGKKKREAITCDEQRRRAAKKELAALGTFLVLPDKAGEKQITTRNRRSEAESSKRKVCWKEPPALSNGRSETKSSKKEEPPRAPSNGRSETKSSKKEPPRALETKLSKKKEPPRASRTRTAKATATSNRSQSRSKSPERRASTGGIKNDVPAQKKNPSRKSRGDQAWHYTPK